MRNAVVVAPDIGASRRARNFAERPGSAPGHHREAAQPGWQRARASSISLVTYRASNAIIFDDEIDTGGTIAQAAEFVRQRGALDVYACATHALLSPPEGVENMKAAKLKELVVTNTVYHLARKVPGPATLLASAVSGRPAGRGDPAHPPGHFGWGDVQRVAGLSEGQSSEPRHSARGYDIVNAKGIVE